MANVLGEVRKIKNKNIIEEKRENQFSWWLNCKTLNICVLVSVGDLLFVDLVKSHSTWFLFHCCVKCLRYVGLLNNNWIGPISVLWEIIWIIWFFVVVLSLQFNCCLLQFNRNDLMTPVKLNDLTFFKFAFNALQISSS